MPAAFNRCARTGGRVRTKTLSKGRHQKICYKSGKSYAGHTKKTKGRNK